jgi:NTE family protein
MFLTRQGSARHALAFACAATLAAFSLLPAQQIDALAAEVPVATPAPAAPDTVAPSAPAATPAAFSDSAVVASPDSATAANSVPAELPLTPSALDSAVASVALPANAKSVLYLGGGENSPWFHLGVLYAIEAYSVPVDSVVGTSWGALVGALWAKGVSPDNIQRILLDPDMATIFDALENGLYQEGSRQNASRPSIPVSETGVPSLRERFSIQLDSSGRLHRQLKPLSPDSSAIESALARLRLQESVLRHREGYRIPFATLGCDGVTGDSYESIFASLPVRGNDKSGEYCPYLALPLEDSPNEVAIIAVADPIRGTSGGPAWHRVIRDAALRNLGSQPGVIVRAHSLQDSSRNGWIQAGFSALESRLTQMSALGSRKADYAANRIASVPWFKFKPVYDSLPPETHGPVKSYWNASDTGLVAPRNFAYGVSRFPSFDSVSFDMLSDGDVLVASKVLPTFDVAVGGFGSNAVGPNAYAELSFYYVDQMQIELSLSGFYGGRSYGFSPSLRIERLWSKDWGLSVRYDWNRMRPFESFVENQLAYRRVYAEDKSDISASLYYRFYTHQSVSANFLFADREVELESKIYGDEPYNYYPASQKIRYSFEMGDTATWFPLGGLAAHAELGLTSVGYDFGFDEHVPSFYTFYADAAYSASPRPFVTLGAFAAFAMNKYHKDGYGYVYPESFEISALDNCIRPRIAASPWSTEWLNPDLASHHYGLVRLNAGFHYKGLGAWVYAAYVRDFEENPTASLGKDRFVLEPALRFSYKSINIYAGMSRIVDSDTFGDLKKFGDYDLFFRVGNYNLF